MVSSWIFILSIKEYIDPNPDLFPKNSFFFSYELLMIHADKQTILLKKENGHLSVAVGENWPCFPQQRDGTVGQKIRFNHDGREVHKVLLWII